MAQAGYVHQEYPKWVEKDGKKFVVQNEVEHRQHFPDEETPVAVVSVDSAPPVKAQAPAGEPVEKPRKRKK